MASHKDLPSSSNQGEVKGPYDDLFSDSLPASVTASLLLQTTYSDVLPFNEYDEKLALFLDDADMNPTPIAEFGTNPLLDLTQFPYLELMTASHQQEHASPTSGGTTISTSPTSLVPTPLLPSFAGSNHPNPTASNVSQLELHHLHHHARKVSCTSSMASSSGGSSSSSSFFCSGGTATQQSAQGNQSVYNGNATFLNFPQAAIALPTANQPTNSAFMAMYSTPTAQPQAPTQQYQVHQVASVAQAMNGHHQGPPASFQDQLRELEKAVSLVKPNDFLPMQMQVPCPIQNAWAPPPTSLVASESSTTSTGPVLATTKKQRFLPKKAAKSIAKSKPKKIVAAAAVAPSVPIKPLSTYNFFFRWERKRILQNVHDTEGPQYLDWDEDFQRQVVEAHWAEDHTTKRKVRLDVLLLILFPQVHSERFCSRSCSITFVRLFTTHNTAS